MKRLDHYVSAMSFIGPFPIESWSLLHLLHPARGVNQPMSVTFEDEVRLSHSSLLFLEPPVVIILGATSSSSALPV